MASRIDNRAPPGSMLDKRVKRERAKPRGGRERDPAHLDKVRRLPCLVCRAPGPSQAAHVRYGDSAHGKPPTGLGAKPSDKWTVPLCARCHQDGPDAQHKSGERAWWARRWIDPVAVAKALHAAGGVEGMVAVIMDQRGV